MSEEVLDPSNYQRLIYTYLYHPEYQLYNKTHVRLNFQFQTCTNLLPSTKMKHIRHDKTLAQLPLYH